MSRTIYYTVEEAQSRLKSVMPALVQMVMLKKKLNELGFDVYKHEYYGGMGPNGTGKFPDEMEELIKIVKNLSSLSIEIKNVDTALIDFRHIRNNGEEVYLCYLLGEEKIEYWHSLSEGFAGRKTLDEL
ncbi:MAG: DUF2203 domain-containing protein [Ignavibacteriae bacterium]|nr:DUF2203 domain-containing protein [Ignavibacteriota bacterium]